MVICDFCKDINVKTFRVNLKTIKEEVVKGKERTRQMINIPIDCCEGCIDNLHQEIGYFICNLRKEAHVPKHKLKPASPEIKKGEDSGHSDSELHQSS